MTVLGLDLRVHTSLRVRAARGRTLFAEKGTAATSEQCHLSITKHCLRLALNRLRICQEGNEPIKRLFITPCTRLILTIADLMDAEILTTVFTT